MLQRAIESGTQYDLFHHRYGLARRIFQSIRLKVPDLDPVEAEELERITFHDFAGVGAGKGSATAGRIEDAEDWLAIVLANHEPIAAVVFHQRLAEHEFNLIDAELRSDLTGESVDIWRLPCLVLLQLLIVAVNFHETPEGLRRFLTALG